MSGGMELDERGWQQRLADARADRVSIADALTPGAFEGAFDNTLLGAVRSFGHVAQGAGILLGGTVGQALDAAFEPDGSHAIQDAIFRATDKATQPGIDFATPDPHTVGTVGRVLGGLAEMTGPLMAGGGTPLVLAPVETTRTAKELIDEGVDARTAAEMGSLQGISSYAGFKLPFLGNTLAKRMLTGAAGNLALGAGTAEAQKKILESQGYQELAQRYDPADFTSRAVDLLSGLTFGGLAHVAAPPSVRDAVLTAQDAKHFQQDTAPGVPQDPAADLAHQRGMQSALEALDRGDEVPPQPQVAAANYTPRPARPDVSDVVHEVLGGVEEPQRQVTETPPPTGEAAVRNPLTFDASPEVKLGELKALTEENVPLVQKIVDQLNESLPGTKSKLSIKDDAKILEKAARPSILQRKPYFGVEHIRDALRFKTVVDSFSDLPKVVDALKEHGVGVEKIDTGKVLQPELWGWRIAALDLRMPNGQLVEHYMPLKELEAAKKGGNHQLFEKWRNKDVTKLSAKELAEMNSDIEKSRGRYQAAWEAALARTGLDESAVRASLTSFEDSAASLTGTKDSLSSAPVTGTSVRQTPSIRTPEKPGSKTTTSVPSRDLKTDIADSSGRIIPEGGHESPVISAVKELLNQQDVQVATGETDAEGNPVTRSGRELMAEADAEIARAEHNSKAFEAAAGCLLTRGSDAR